MAFSLLDFARRRKLAVLLGVAVAVVTLLYYTHSLTRKSIQNTPVDVEVDADDAVKQLTPDLSSGREKDYRTSIGKETSKGGEAVNHEEEKEEEGKGVPLNKGNLLQVINDKEEEKERVEYPEVGEEIKPPKIGDNEKVKMKEEERERDGRVNIEQGVNKVEAETELNNEHKQDSGEPLKLDKQVKPGTHSAVDVITDRHSNRGKPETTNNTVTQRVFKFPKSEDIYVHSSMPLGPALKVQHSEMQRAVVKAFKHAWSSYKKYAWGHDDLLPLSKSYTSVEYGMAMTMVDSLDTMWLMGLQEEFEEARDWIEENLNFDENRRKVIVFEVNIRVLGGLLSAYHLSGDEMFLRKAVLLADRLMPAFGTPSGLPVNRIDLQKGLTNFKKSVHSDYGSINLAEAGSLQLEFRDLSRATGDPKYQSAVDRTSDVLYKSSNSGLFPQYFSVTRGQGSSSTYTVGSGADSFYEYLLKQWVQSNKAESKFQLQYLKSARAIKDHLVGYTKPSSLPFLGVKSGGMTGILMSTMEHLACFYPGTLALGLINSLHHDQRSLAEGLTQSCYVAYNSTRSGLAADSFVFNTSPYGKGDYVRASDEKNMQRPETVESLFLMYRLTKDRKYRDWGWQIFQAFDKNLRVEGGFAGLSSVNHIPPLHSNRMESFFLAETLKYLFLLFGDNDSVLSLNEWVFNTEAHPLPVWKVKVQPQAEQSHDLKSH